MPRQKKVSFNQKLASYDVLIEDTSINSDYFKVSQFPEGVAGGKNGFLLAGTPFLVPNSRILVEVVNELDEIGLLLTERGSGGFGSSGR
jgi:hypothetical protein